ncbi:MAG: hypothetical protein ACFB4J_07825 [Elainellaceae cyanobacterium]
MALLIGILILAALALFAVENWAPAVPLVVLGAQTAALPMALWVIGALLAGALTVAAIAALLELLGPSSRGPSRGDRYADEDDLRRRYVVDEPPDSPLNQGRARRVNRPNPYVDEVDAPEGYQESVDIEVEDEGYRPFSMRNTSSAAASRGDDWDSFSQPRQSWGDWDAPRRASASQTNRDSRRSRRDARVDQVLDVESVEVRRDAERAARDRRYGVGVDEDLGQDLDEDLNDWSNYEEPAPQVEDRPYSDYSDSPPHRSQRTYRPPPRPARDSRKSYEDAPYEPPYEPAYQQSPEPDYPRYPQHDAAEGYAAEDYTPEDYAARNYASNSYSDTKGYAAAGYASDNYSDADEDDYPDSSDRAGEGKADGDYEDYIVDYGDEAEIDQFSLNARASRQPASGASADGGDIGQSGAQDREDENWEDENWEDWDVEPNDASAAPEASTARDIYEVPAAPETVSRSGSLYSYRYRRDAAEDGPETPDAVAVPTPQSNNNDAEDTPRILIPPHAPDAAGPNTSSPDTSDPNASDPDASS